MPLAGCLPTNLRCTRLTRKIVVFSSNCTKSSAPTSVHPNNGIHCRVGRIQVCLPFRIGPIASKWVNPEKFSRDLAARINQLMRDRHLREKFGKAGRKRAEENFSSSAIAKKTIALYESLLK